MGRRTDVGVLSILATMDSSQFTKALDKTGQKTKAWAVRIKGTMNSIGGSVTELNSRISFLAGSMEMGIKTVTGLRQAAEMLFAPSVENAEALQKTLESMPMGIGAVVSAMRQLQEVFFELSDEGKKLREELTFWDEQTEAMGKTMARMQEARKLQTETTNIRRDMFRGELSEELKAREALQEKVKKLELDSQRAKLKQAQKELSDFLAKVAADPDSWRNNAFQRETQQQLESAVKAEQQLMDALKERERALVKVFEKERAAAAAKKKAAAEELALEKRREAAAEKLANALDRRAKALKELETMRKAYEKQSQTVAGLRAQQAAGATQTVSTAIGAIKIGDESQTRALQQAQLAELRKETQILEDIRQKISRSGGALI